MSKDGFTLLEIMGVITIIGILALITVPIVDRNIKQSKEELYESQLTMIELSAKNWISDNPTFLDTYYETNDSPYVVSLQSLIDVGYIEKPVVDPRSDTTFDYENTTITITRQTDYRYTYEVDVVLD